MKVYPLWHISHQNVAGPSDETIHLDDGGVFIDEQDGDDVKLLGIYSSEAAAEERMRRARLLPGFVDEPDCFQIGEYDLDGDHWTEGFVRVPV
ncbi:hypothetical protein [Kitasatospora sp. A2-31]|uniref:DUF7336 domain-containing protein n=1 Tax=Kitasatospora sp. A2-31 TaxID=2916414 RepID=UPI001EEE430D|nr:hypothetical protein [Kitasatospora sp. A2-31]MCG6499866.1 hypothetical protein [Kitasatospora sp. A2-31]MCG6500105.1 hypothetical protein [Kitasatospora sp. A2-31]